MMKQLIIWGLSIATSTVGMSQSKTAIDTIAANFDEIQIATQQHQSLWNIDLYAPMLLVHPVTRQLFANFPDSAGNLKKAGPIYTGTLPQDVNIANTSVHWSGRDWAMVMLPLPADKNDRLNLLAHELFHRAQKALDFVSYNPANNHLDQKDGRVNLRLELEALKDAVLAPSSDEMITHLRNALAFRKYRRSLYAGADSSENLLELNEGIAEFTGVMVSGRNKQQTQAHFVESIKRFLAYPTFVRSFAYETTPIYGYLLCSTRPTWNQDINGNSDLTEYFRKAFNIQLPGYLKDTVSAITNQYNGQTIIAEELAREEKIRRLVAEYRSTFIEQSRLDLRIENMKFSFDFQTIMPLDDKGTVYPSLRVTDNWGILTVERGALISSDWRTITVSQPTNVERKKVSGDGWTLVLNDGYSVQKADGGNNYILTKK